MKLYSNEKIWREKLESVPGPLRAKRLKEIDSLYKSQGFKGQGGGEDAAGPYINVKLRPGLTPGDIANFCEREGFAAASLEPQDMAVLFGNSPIGLGAQRGLEVEGTAGTGSLPSVELLEPSEIADAVQNIAWKSFANNGPTSLETEELVVKDLVTAGLMSQADADATDNWRNADTNKQAAIDHANLNGEWAYENSFAEEWG